MTDELSGKTIAFLVANSGVEQVELTTPWEAVEKAGGTPVLVAPEKDTVQAFNNDVEKADTFDADRGGRRCRRRRLRRACCCPAAPPTRTRCGWTTRRWRWSRRSPAPASRSPPSATGPWSLVEADVVRGKTLTSWPSLQTDIRNAGGEWQDDEAFTCTEGSYTLVTSRNPDDLDAFVPAAVDVFARAERRHARRRRERVRRVGRAAAATLTWSVLLTALHDADERARARPVPPCPRRRRRDRAEEDRRASRPVVATPTSKARVRWTACAPSAPRSARSSAPSSSCSCCATSPSRSRSATPPSRCCRPHGRALRRPPRLPPEWAAGRARRRWTSSVPRGSVLVAVAAAAGRSGP